MSMPLGSAPRRTQKWRGLRAWNYVYELVDPRNGAPFYVGSGKGDRFDEHEREAAWGIQTPKCQRIRDIHVAGFKVEKRIVGLFKARKSAFDFERQLIKELPGLTNGKSWSIQWT